MSNIAIDLTGKTAILLGGVNSLTVDVGYRLADAGATVIPTRDSKVSAWDAIYAGDPVRLDDPDTLATEIAARSPIHIAVISPGWFTVERVLDTSAADWDAALEYNFEHSVYAAQAAARQMIAQGHGGRIIFLSSVAALTPLAYASALGTSLRALHSVARMAAVDLGPHGITVNIVAVGWTPAEWNREFLTPDGQAYIEQGIPAGRIGTLKDVGDLCCFLASDMAGYITGAVIPVDGGYTLTKSDGGTAFPGKSAG